MHPDLPEAYPRPLSGDPLLEPSNFLSAPAARQAGAHCRDARRTRFTEPKRHPADGFAASPHLRRLGRRVP